MTTNMCLCITVFIRHATFARMGVAGVTDFVHDGALFCSLALDEEKRSLFIMGMNACLNSRVVYNTSKTIVAKRSRGFAKRSFVWEYSHPKNRTDTAPTEAVTSNVDWTNTSLRKISENLLTLFATMIDVGDMSLFRANALVLRENPRMQDRSTTQMDFT